MRSRAHRGRCCVTFAGRRTDGLGDGLAVTVAEGPGVAEVDGAEADADALSDDGALGGGEEPSVEQPLRPSISATEAVARILHNRR